MLLLHSAAVQIQRQFIWRGYILHNRSHQGLPHDFGKSWWPSDETFMSWLAHHKIAYRLPGGLVSAGPRAAVFAAIPNRNRVRLIGEIILAFERYDPLKPARERKSL